MENSKVMMKAARRACLSRRSEDATPSRGVSAYDHVYGLFGQSGFTTVDQNAYNGCKMIIDTIK